MAAFLRPENQINIVIATSGIIPIVQNILIEQSILRHLCNIVMHTRD